MFIIVALPFGQPPQNFVLKSSRAPIAHKNVMQQLSPPIFAAQLIPALYVRLAETRVMMPFLT
jgi:hypothetical protein